MEAWQRGSPDEKTELVSKISQLLLGISRDEAQALSPHDTPSPSLSEKISSMLRGDWQTCLLLPETPTTQAHRHQSGEEILAQQATIPLISSHDYHQVCQPEYLTSLIGWVHSFKLATLSHFTC